jgi:hypothetical protein
LGEKSNSQLNLQQLLSSSVQQFPQDSSHSHVPHHPDQKTENLDRNLQLLVFFSFVSFDFSFRVRPFDIDIC